MLNVLVQLQLSNYTSDGTWLLECDSGYQMCFGRIRELLRIRDDVSFDVLGPPRSAMRMQPEMVTPDVFASDRVRWIEIPIIPNALVTRYDFNFAAIAAALRDSQHDIVYVNDPMLLRAYMAVFHVNGRKRPRFVVHSHFIDNPEQPKFPADASLWMGQLEAACRADYNFWQCESALNTFLQSAQGWLSREQLRAVRAKSRPWDDGYSIAEITSDPDERNIRFDVAALRALAKRSTVIFVPNRVGGRGRSSDYTNCGKFLFDLLPAIRERSGGELTIIAGNPSQKFSNAELVTSCGVHDLIPDAPNRDELKMIMRTSNIVVGLYSVDQYGGTASREAVELGATPLWIDNHEYSLLAKRADFKLLAKDDFSDIVDVAARLITAVRDEDQELRHATSRLRDVVRNTCSYESTTQGALAHMITQ